MVVPGNLERLTPVLMTVLSAGFALVPLMLDADAPGKEILPAVAITIFGGLVSATGRLAAPASGRVTAVLQLTTDGNPAQARFAIAQ